MSLLVSGLGSVATILHISLVEAAMLFVCLKYNSSRIVSFSALLSILVAKRNAGFVSNVPEDQLQKT